LELEQARPSDGPPFFVKLKGGPVEEKRGSLGVRKKGWKADGGD